MKNFQKLIKRPIFSLNGQVSDALAYHERLMPLFKALFSTTSPIPVKAALELKGWPVGPPRSPLLRLNSQMKDELSKILSALPKH